MLFVVDLSASGGFGSRLRTKGELGAEVAAVLALAAARNNDRVGAVFFTDRVEYHLAPAKGRRHVLRLISDLLAFAARRHRHRSGRRARRAGADASAAGGHLRALRFPGDRATRPCSPGWRGGTTWSGCSWWIRASASCRHAGMVTLWDPETERVAAGGYRRRPRCGRSSPRRAESSTAGWSGRCAERGADLLRLETGRPYAEPLLTFFRRRERMLWR